MQNCSNEIGAIRAIIVYKITTRHKMILFSWKRKIIYESVSCLII